MFSCTWSILISWCNKHFIMQVKVAALSRWDGPSLCSQFCSIFRMLLAKNCLNLLKFCTKYCRSLFWNMVYLMYLVTVSHPLVFHSVSNGNGSDRATYMYCTEIAYTVQLLKFHINHASSSFFFISIFFNFKFVSESFWSLSMRQWLFISFSCFC